MTGAAATAAAACPALPVQALLLQMVGGVGREFPGSGMKLRGDIHICLMGDPGERRRPSWCALLITTAASLGSLACAGRAAAAQPTADMRAPGRWQQRL